MITEEAVKLLHCDWWFGRALTVEKSAIFLFLRLISGAADELKHASTSI